MKLTNRRFYTQHLISVLICLLLIGGGLEGAVLCIGSDGHIDLELAFNGVCDGAAHFSSAEYSQFAQKAKAHPDNRHCQPCLDIPVSVGCTGVFFLSNQAKPTPFPATASTTLAVSGTEFSEVGLTPELLATANPHLIYLCSIILLI